VNVTLRRAEPRDVDFLLELMTHEDVDPFMAVIRPRASLSVQLTP